jgi:glycosyltransferase involved in cell wall biosynthesis
MQIGFHNPYLGVGSLGGGDRYLFAMLAEAARLPGTQIELHSPRQPTREDFAMLGLDLSPEAFRWTPAGEEEVSERSRELDLLVVLATDVPLRNRARHGVAMIQFPFRARERAPERALAALLALSGRARAAEHLRSYDRFLCNSRFTREWIERRLGVDAEVLSPPVDEPGESPRRERASRILSVGRFFRNGHEKRQDVLIEAFRALRARGGAEGWELHLVGTVDPRPATERWLERLRGMAEGLPVRFHVEAAREELLQLYATSALYWHAAGFGVNPRRHPERLEHFGIATVEAMMHGAVPLVLPLGGQAELVEDGHTGRHWRTIEELVERTRELVAAPARGEALRRAAYAEAQAHGTSRFRTRIRALLLELLEDSA